MPSPIEDIKARLSIVDVVGSYIRLIKAGSNFKANCPFHNEKTPSFFVSPSRDSWHCFGCNSGGDIFSFVSRLEGVEFPEALQILAARAGVELKKEDPRLVNERKRLFNLFDDAVKFYESELSKRDDVFKYLEMRGLLKKTINDFRLGYAHQSWDRLTSFLKSKGYKPEEMERAGLAIRAKSAGWSDSGARFYDRFRGRIMFPLSDPAGRVVGFSGRIFEPDLPKNESPENAGGKYINTPQTALYDKSKILYLWDRARGEIRKENTCVLVEGQMDALLSHQAGVKNTVAVSGTALSKNHLWLIKRLASDLFLSFDTDDAGQSATMRGVDLAIASGLEVKIIAIPQGKDPADTIKENPKIWTQAVSSAKPVISHFLERSLKKFGSDHRGLRLDVTSKVLPYVALLNNEVDKAHWIGEISSFLGLKEDPIWDEVRKLSKRGREVLIEYKRPEAEKMIPKTRKDLLEDRILGILAWRKDEFLEKLNEGSYEFFSSHRIPLLECVIKEKPPKDAEVLEKNLEKLAFEAELLYGAMEKIHEEFHELLAELEKEHFKTKKTGKNEFAPERIDQLLEKGKTRGFVTYAEILHMFPHIEDNVIFLDELYTRFQAGGVDVLEGTEMLEVKGKKEGKKAPDELTEQFTSDSVEMYLREMGKIPLWKGDEEKELAKKIKKGDQDAKNKLNLADFS